MKKTLVLVLIFLSINFQSVLAISPSQQPRMSTTSKAPYLFYLDGRQAAFVIERADGTDSRLLGEGLMTSRTNHVDGPSWSPSGKWFAWTSSWLDGGTSGMIEDDLAAFAVSADGKRKLNAFSNMRNVSMQWAPSEDVLLVAGLVNPPHTEPMKPAYEGTKPVVWRIALVDAEKDKMAILKDITLDMTSGEVSSSRGSVSWTRDGNSIMVWHSSRYDVAPAVFYAMQRDGTGYRSGVDIEDGEIVLPHVDATGERSAYGLVALKADHAVTIKNLVTGKRKDYPFPDKDIRSFDWSADGTQALLIAQPVDCRAACPSDIILFTPQNEQFKMLFSGKDNANFMGWSPDEKAFAFRMFDSPPSSLLRLYYVNLETRKVTATDGWGGSTIVWDNPHYLTVSNMADADNSQPYTVYKIDGSSVSNLTSFSIPGDWVPGVAPNGQQAGYTRYGIHLLDLVKNTTRDLPPDDRSYFADGPGEVVWHPSSPWAIVLESALVAGGGYLRWTGIINSDGGSRRGLGFCFAPTPTCINWLPERVDPATLAPGKDMVILRPQKEILNTHWMSQLIWSPDGKQIANGDDFRSEGGATPFEVWDVATGQQVDSLDKVAWEETITWKDGKAQITPRKAADRDVYPYTLATSPDGSRLLQFVEQYGEQVTIVDSASGRTLHTFDDINTWRLNADFSPDGKLIAIGNASQRTRIVDAQTGKTLATLPVVGMGPAFSPDGKTLAVAASFNIQLWDVATLLK